MSFKIATQQRSSNRINRSTARASTSTRVRPTGYHLQRTIGNSATSRFLPNTPIQAKLTVSNPGDASEREADRVAGEVMSPPAIQRAPKGEQRGPTRGPTWAVAYGGEPKLHGQADAVFDGGKKEISNVKTSRATGCDCPTKQSCMKATGTLRITYKVTVKITMPPMPKGLSKCKQDRVTAFFKNVLGPHEQKHKRGYETYNGTTQHKIEGLGCGKDGAKDALDAEARRILDEEAAPREKSARHESDKWDPFFEMVDFDGCK